MVVVEGEREKREGKVLYIGGSGYPIVFSHAIIRRGNRVCNQGSI